MSILILSGLSFTKQQSDKKLIFQKGKQILIFSRQRKLENIFQTHIAVDLQKLYSDELFKLVDSRCKRKWLINLIF